MKELTPILFCMTDMVNDLELEPVGVPHLHQRHQEHPPKSRRFLRNTLFFDIFSHAYISEVDEGINPNSLLIIRYGQEHAVKSNWGSWSPLQGSGTSSKVKKVPEKYPVFYIVSHAYISEVDKGIIPNPLLKIRYGQVHHIGSVLGSWNPSQESGKSSKIRKCSWWMQNVSINIFKIQRSVTYQIVCILKDKSIGVLKITYGHHPWGQERPPCIRKALSGTFLINYFFWHLYKCCISNCMYFSRQIWWWGQFKSRLPSSLDQEDSISSSIRNIPDPLIFWVSYKCCISNCMYFFW